MHYLDYCNANAFVIQPVYKTITYSLTCVDDEARNVPITLQVTAASSPC